MQPTGQPSGQPSRQPSGRPTGQPTGQPSGQPTAQPQSRPTGQPSHQPTTQPSQQPTGQPTGQPTRQPSSRPTGQPTRQPTGQPSRQPTSRPSGQPSRQPTGQPTCQPSQQPTGQPSRQPTSQPTRQPSRQPTGQPSRQPTGQPSAQPSRQPTGQPTQQPSTLPSGQPSGQPTSEPSGQPSTQPTVQPSLQPTGQPSCVPSGQPSAQPSRQPSGQPSRQPTRQPTGQPSLQPTRQPTGQPSRQPTGQPSRQPSRQPTGVPTGQPTGQPSMLPTGQPTRQPSMQPTGQPSAQPSRQPTVYPTGQPTRQPTGQPSRQPTRKPTGQPSRQPTGQPSRQPTRQPSREPSGQPTGQPTMQPSRQPSCKPTGQPSRRPSGQPSRQPTCQPTGQPSRQPTGQPTRQPTAKPSGWPTGQPSRQPSCKPSGQPTCQPTNPTGQPSGKPSRQPTGQPTSNPVRQPSSIRMRLACRYAATLPLTAAQAATKTEARYFAVALWAALHKDFVSGSSDPQFGWRRDFVDSIQVGSWKEILTSTYSRPPSPQPTLTPTRAPVTRAPTKRRKLEMEGKAGAVAAAAAAAQSSIARELVSTTVTFTVNVITTRRYNLTVARNPGWLALYRNVTSRLLTALSTNYLDTAYTNARNNITTTNLAFFTHRRRRLNIGSTIIPLGFDVTSENGGNEPTGSPSGAPSSSAPTTHANRLSALGLSGTVSAGTAAPMALVAIVWLLCGMGYSFVVLGRAAAARTHKINSKKRDKLRENDSALASSAPTPNKGKATGPPSSPSSISSSTPAGSGTSANSASPASVLSHASVDSLLQAYIASLLGLRGGVYSSAPELSRCATEMGCYHLYFAPIYGDAPNLAAQELDLRAAAWNALVRNLHLATYITCSAGILAALLVRQYPQDDLSCLSLLYADDCMAKTITFFDSAPYCQWLSPDNICIKANENQLSPVVVVLTALCGLGLGALLNFLLTNLFGQLLVSCDVTEEPLQYAHSLARASGGGSTKGSSPRSTKSARSSKSPGGGQSHADAAAAALAQALGAASTPAQVAALTSRHAAPFESPPVGLLHKWSLLSNVFAKLHLAVDYVEFHQGNKATPLRLRALAPLHHAAPRPSAPQKASVSNADPRSISVLENTRRCAAMVHLMACVRETRDRMVPGKYRAFFDEQWLLHDEAPDPDAAESPTSAHSADYATALLVVGRQGLGESGGGSAQTTSRLPSTPAAAEAEAASTPYTFASSTELVYSRLRPSGLLLPRPSAAGVAYAPESDAAVLAAKRRTVQRISDSALPSDTLSLGSALACRALDHVRFQTERQAAELRAKIHAVATSSSASVPTSTSAQKQPSALPHHFLAGYSVLHAFLRDLLGRGRSSHVERIFRAKTEADVGLRWRARASWACTAFVLAVGVFLNVIAVTMCGVLPYFLTNGWLYAFYSTLLLWLAWDVFLVQPLAVYVSCYLVPASVYPHVQAARMLLYKAAVSFAASLIDGGIGSKDTLRRLDYKRLHVEALRRGVDVYAADDEEDVHKFHHTLLRLEQRRQDPSRHRPQLAGPPSASHFFFLSHALAAQYPHLFEAQLVEHFRTPWLDPVGAAMRGFPAVNQTGGGPTPTPSASSHPPHDNSSDPTPSPTASTGSDADFVPLAHSVTENALLLPLSVLQQWNADSKAWERHMLQFQLRSGRDAKDFPGEDTLAAAAATAASAGGLLRGAAMNLGLVSAPPPRAPTLTARCRGGISSGSVNPGPTLSTRERLILGKSRSKAPSSPRSAPVTEVEYLVQRSHGLGIARRLGKLCSLLLLLLGAASYLPLVLLRRLAAALKTVATLLYFSFLSMSAAAQLAIICTLLPTSCFIIGYGCLVAGSNNAALLVPLALMAVHFAWLLAEWARMVVSALREWRRRFRGPSPGASGRGRPQTVSSKSAELPAAQPGKAALAVMQLDPWVSKDLANVKTAVTLVETEVRRFFHAHVLAKEQLLAEQRRWDQEQEKRRLRLETTHRLSLFAATHLSTQWLVQCALMALSPPTPPAHMELLHPDDTKPAPVQDVISISRLVLACVDEACPVVPDFGSLVARVSDQVKKREAMRQELFQQMQQQRAASLLVAKRLRLKMAKQAQAAKLRALEAEALRLAAQHAAQRKYEADVLAKHRATMEALFSMVEAICGNVAEEAIREAREQQLRDDEERARAYAEMRMTMLQKREEQHRRERQQALEAERAAMREKIEAELAAEEAKRREDEAERDAQRRIEEEERWREEKARRDALAAIEEEKARQLRLQAEEEAAAEAAKDRLAKAALELQLREWEARQKANDEERKQQRLEEAAHKDAILLMAGTSEAVAEKSQERDKEESRRRLQERLLLKKAATTKVPSAAPQAGSEAGQEAEAKAEAEPLPQPQLQEAEAQLQPEAEPPSQAETRPDGESESEAEVPVAARQAAVSSFFSSISTKAQASLDESAGVEHSSERLAAANFLLSMSSKLEAASVPEEDA